MRKMTTIIIEGRLTGFILLFSFMIIVALIVYRTRSTGKLPWLRRIAAIDAIEDAVGRAVEMGKPVICGFGRARSFDSATLAGLSTLSYVAEFTATMGADLIVPLGGGDMGTAGPVTVPIAEELVRTAYTSKGKEEDFKKVEMPYLSDESFCVSTSVVAMLQKLRPGAHVFIGQYYAETMFLAEVSRAVGAISIAGSSGVSGNVACLAVACDYIVIGEEVPAIGAYLSGDPTQRGSIFAQDIIKIITLILIFFGYIAFSFGNDFFSKLISL
jgi:hypothetical protein